MEVISIAIGLIGLIPLAKSIIARRRKKMSAKEFQIYMEVHRQVFSTVRLPADRAETQIYM